jgi:cytochrome c-type biogenesis protein CcmH/NrfG
MALTAIGRTDDMTNTMKLNRLALLTAMGLAGCAQLPGLGESEQDVYTRQREAVAAYETGVDARAEPLLQGLLRVSPNDPENWFRLGNLYARTDRPKQAVDAFEHALMLRTDDARVWHNLAVVRIRQAQAAVAQANAAAINDPALYEKTRRMAEQLQGVLASSAKTEAPAAPAPNAGSHDAPVAGH